MKKLYLTIFVLLSLVNGLCTAVAQESNAPTAAEASAVLEPAVNVSDPAVTNSAPATNSNNVSTSTRLTPTPAQQREQVVQNISPRIMDTLDLGTTSITGNQELPKVLYIVPWKRSDLGDLVGRPVNTLLDEVLAPIDPEVFERHLDYYDTLYRADEQE